MGYRPTPQQKSTAPKDYVPGDFQLAQLITKVDNLNIGIAKIMSMITEMQDKNPTAHDNAQLRQQVTELEEVIKKQGNSFIPANQVRVSGDNQTTELTAEHVRDMVKKGEEDEELEI